MKRREFITLLGGATAWPLVARAQQASKLPTIGFLAANPSIESQRVAAFVQRLRERGWIDRRNLVIEYRWAEGRNERYAENAAELVRLKVDVIVTIATPPTVAAKQATAVTPIVFAAASDPVGTGLVASLARPGGNVTGLSNQISDAGGKRIELLREVVPGLRRLAILANVGNPASVLDMDEAQATARTLGLDVTTSEIRQSGSETIVEPLEQRIPIAGAHRRHEEHVADWRATAPHATLSLELATLEGIRRNAYQRSHLLATHTAEFGQERNQGTGQHRSDARHGGEQSVSVRERRIGHNDLDQALIEHVDIGCEASDAATRKPLQHGIFEQSGGILGGDFLGAELAANGKHLDQPFERRGAWLRRASGHDGDERRDHAGIERIVLRQNAARLGELPQLERIDLAHGHAGCEQRAHDTTLVASASLKSDRRDRGAAQLLDQFGPAGGIVADRRALLLGQYHNVQTILRHIDAGEREHCHLRIPSLLMRARAQATVRVWKKRPKLQAHSRTGVRSACGLPVATGGRS